MNVTEILQGRHGFNAKQLAASTLQNQLAWAINRTLNTTKKEDTTSESDAAFDAALEAEMRDVVSDYGQPKAKPLPLDLAIETHAAAFVLFRRYLNEQNPDTGRRSEHLDQYLVPLPKAVLLRVKANAQRNYDEQKAEAAKLGVPFDAREKAIREDMDATATRLMQAVKQPWMAAWKVYETYATDDLIDTVLEGCVECSINAAAEIRRSADNLRDVVRKRMVEGKFARLADDIWALTTAATQMTTQSGGPDVDVAPAT